MIDMHNLKRFYNDMGIDEEDLSFESFTVIAKNYIEVTE